MSGRTLLLALCVALFGFPSVQARPVHKQALAQYFGPFLSKKLNDCRTCHLPDPPGSVASGQDYEKPHNAFGLRLKTVKEELRKAGKKTSLEARLEAILAEDADGDGVGNLIEILTGHYPGEKDDHPTTAELANLQELLSRFSKFRKSYPWRPLEVVQRPAVPKVRNASWVRNPIDAFISAEHENLGLQPRPEAPRAVLLRRLYIDLVGLPPTPQELHAFLRDPSPEAYERVVDQLLASPRYGERWGRHWMDVWRYSDWAGWGAQVRDSQPHIWHWRDWIIDALNEDKGYDRMVQEMLAGDELAPEDPRALMATGYLVRNYKLLSREKWLQDTVEHTFMAFQGLTIGCAKCHDHMYDPILHSDYYRFRAFFEPHQVRTDRLPGQPDPKIDGLVRVYDANLGVPTYLFVRGDDRNADKSKALQPGVPEVIAGGFPKIEPVNLPRSAIVPDRRAFVTQQTIDASKRDIATTAIAAALCTPINQKEIALSRLCLDLAEAKHHALIKVLDVEALEESTKEGPVWTEAATAAELAQRRATLLEAKQKIAVAEQKMAKGPAKMADAITKELADAQKQLAKAEAGVKMPPTTAFKRRDITVYPAQSSGRRLALAKWLTGPENPLTARVAVNHIWLRHFGVGIVPSVFDFGRNGRPPSHPALLDWLALEFVEPTITGTKPWSMKALHRLMVTSSTYRMASSPDAADAAIDRDNKYLWRYNSRPAEAEVVRDCIFYVAGRLDFTMGGPEIDFPLGLTVPRRSVYFRHAAEKQMEFLQIFDGPSVTECYERKQAIVPGQALALINSEVTLKNARLLARTLSEKTEPDVFITRAFEQVLSRPPTPEEMAECSTFLVEQTRRFQETKIETLAAKTNDSGSPSPKPALRARENLVHVLMNHHEFVTIR
jgi:hypothetical protein